MRPPPPPPPPPPPLVLLDNMYKYEMNPTKTVSATEQTWDAGRMDRWADGQSETNIPPNNFVVRGTPQQLRYNNI